jgi:hypothetical protein
MIRKTIRLDQNSDVIAEVDALRAVLAREPMENAHLSTEAERVIRDFIDQGSKIAQIGSQFHGERVLTGTGVEITIKADFGRPRSFFQKLFGR